MIRSLRIAGRRRSRAASSVLGPTQFSWGPWSPACQLLPLPLPPAEDLMTPCGSIGHCGTSAVRWYRSLRSRRRIVRGDGLSGWRLPSVVLFTSQSTPNNRNVTKDRERSNADPVGEEDASNGIYGHWWSQITSPPNLITLARIASAPVLSYFIVSQRHDLALAGCLVAGLSDVLDGYLAKNHNMSTVLGTYLDPLADKVLINVLSVSLWYVGTLPAPLVALWLIKDAALTVGAYRYVAQNTALGRAVMDPWTTPLKVNPTFTSKVNTALQFATLSVAIFVPVHPDAAPILAALCWGTGLTTVASGFSYLGYSAFSSSGNQGRSKGPKHDANPPPAP